MIATTLWQDLQKPTQGQGEPGSHSDSDRSLDAQAMLHALRDDRTLRRRPPPAGAECFGVKPLVEAALSSGAVDDGRYLQPERHLDTMTSNMYEEAPAQRALADLRQRGQDQQVGEFMREVSCKFTDVSWTIHSEVEARLDALRTRLSALEITPPGCRGSRRRAVL